jgi:hypothetical protein
MSLHTPTIRNESETANVTFECSTDKWLHEDVGSVLGSLDIRWAEFTILDMRLDEVELDINVL